MTRPDAAAVEWIQKALRAEIAAAAEAELRERAEAVDAIARNWNVPTEAAVEWIHSDAAKAAQWNSADFRQYCALYASMSKVREQETSKLPKNWPD